MQILDSALSFGSELSDQTTIFDGVILAHGATNCDSSVIYDDNTL